jgi:polysaccharide deacetylase family protein (PEP-CTERM system associated)
MLNALTIDLEDYYQVANFEHFIPIESWGNMESRIERNCDKILSILDEFNVKATFFVLGWIAERHPILVRKIFNEGHEIASHGFNHKMIHKQTDRSFYNDIRKAQIILEDITGHHVKGYRAPTFSINNSTLWALDILHENGYLYDSSIFPINHDRYGIPEADRFPHIIKLKAANTIKEFPPSTLRVFGYNIPIGGGGYLRLFPIQFLTWGIKQINKREKQPAIIYLHPWEFDPDQPRIPVKLASRFRHYINLSTTENKLRHLLNNFNFTTISKLHSVLFT